MNQPASPLSTEELADLRSELPTVTMINPEGINHSGKHPDMVNADIVRRLLATISSLMAERKRLRSALERLADAADAVGVAHFDTDTMEPPVVEMQEATNDHDWKCSGCGILSPDRKRACDCATSCVFSCVNGSQVSAWKYAEGTGEAHINEREQVAYERGKADGIKAAESRLSQRGLTEDELADLQSEFPSVTLLHGETSRGHDEMVNADIARRLLVTIKQARADFREVMKALEDLSFECFSPIAPCNPPSLRTYNRAWEALDKHRKRLGWSIVPDRLSTPASAGKADT